MKKYFRYSTAILLGGLFLGLSGCGSSNGSSCSSGQVQTVGGCSTGGSCTVPGTNQAGGLVGSTCEALSGNATGSYSCAMYGSQYTLQSLPAPYNSYPQYIQTGGQACCPSYINVSEAPPQILQVCEPAQSTTGYGSGYYYP